MGFANCGLPFPVEHGFRCGLGEHGMSAFDVDTLDAAIGFYERVNFYYSLKREITGQCWVGRGRLIDEFTHRPLGMGTHRMQEQHGGQYQHGDRTLS